MTDVDPDQHDGVPGDDRSSPGGGTGLGADQLDYHLPEGHIATEPARPRDGARMLVVERSGSDVEHRHVRDLPEYLRPGDALVFNDTTVIPARLEGRRRDSGGRVEGLFIDEDDQGCWHVMLRSNGRLRPGLTIGLLDGGGSDSPFSLELIERHGEQWVARPGGAAGGAEVILEAVGRTPLPPYILRARGEQIVDDKLDRGWYQTTFADPLHRGSVAAPTAGLHFSPALLSTLDESGVDRCNVTLQVGPGTFKPVTTASLADHEIGWERFEVPAATLHRLAAGRDRGRVVAVGTTSVRALESLPDASTWPSGEPIRSRTNLLIAPPYRFSMVDGLLTNFHLPRSTLLALVAAFLGLERTLGLYEQAVERGYRFYSYGDAMLILP